MADSQRRDSSSSSHAMNVAELRRESSSRRSGDAGLSRRRSVSFSQEAASQALEDIENEIVARAGDDGYSRSSSMRFEINDFHLMEHQAGIVPIDLIIQSNTHDAPSLNTASGTSPLTAEIISSNSFTYVGQNKCSNSETPKTSGPSKIRKIRLARLWRAFLGIS
ncbi:hypothetical protein ACLOJK_033128 [Asimina triloba]